MGGRTSLGGPFFPPSKMLGSFYLSSRLLDNVILLLYQNSLDLYQAENQVFKPTSLFVIVGWGKTGPAHSFPPPKSFDLSIDQLVFRFMLLFHSILTFMKDLYQSENQVFHPTRLLVLLHCGVGKDWAGPFFPPPKSFALSIDQLVFQFMLLFHCILTLMNDRFQREKQVFKQNILFVCYIVGWERLGRPIPPPPSIMLGSFNLLFSLYVYVTL